MGEETPSSGGGATPATGEPATGTPAPGSATPQKPASTLEEALARIAELERHAANKESEAAHHGRKLSAAEKELAAYKAAEQAAKDAQLSEVERIKKQHADLQSQHDALLRETQELKVQSAVERAASKLSFLHPEIAVRLLDRDAIEYEDDGTPKNIEKLLEKLLKHMPELAPVVQASPPPNGTAQAPTAGTPAQPAPALPAMNPPRTSIAPPNTLPPGQVPSWSDIFKR